MALRPKKDVANLKNVTHGGPHYSELKAAGLSTDEVLDFSVCTNPFMPPPDLKKLLIETPVDQYPDSNSTELRQVLSERLGVSSDNVLVGSGTTELIRLLALAYFRRNSHILIIKPAYGEYEAACRLVGARPVAYISPEAENFVPNMQDLIKTVEQHRPSAVFICNPDNPTGYYLSLRDVESIISHLGEGLVILDEAYVSFVENSWNSMQLVKRDNVVILRSMTKDYGIPGLRLGYAVASKEIIDNLRRICPPWNVNSMAQSAGMAVLKEDAYLEQTKVKIQESMQFLEKELSGLGYKVLPSRANYFLVKVGNATAFRVALLKNGILVRDCSSFGLPEYVRIAPRSMEACEKLVNAIIKNWHRKGLI